MRSTYRRLYVPGRILYLSRRTLGRGLLSLCRGCTSESWSSPFYVSSGSRPSSPRIHLEEKWISLINKELKVPGFIFQKSHLIRFLSYSSIFYFNSDAHTCCNLVLLKVLFGSFSIYVNWNASARDVYRVWFQDAGVKAPNPPNIWHHCCIYPVCQLENTA